MCIYLKTVKPVIGTLKYHLIVTLNMSPLDLSTSLFSYSSAIRKAKVYANNGSTPFINALSKWSTSYMRNSTETYIKRIKLNQNIIINLSKAYKGIISSPLGKLS